MKKLTECEKQCPTNISLVFYNIKVFWEQAASYPQLSRKFETHIPKETLLHKVSGKFVANALQSCKKTKGHIGAPEYHNYEWKTCWIIFRHSLQVHCFIKIIWCSCLFYSPPPSSEAVYSGLQREADARYRMICLVMIMINLKITNLVEDVPSLLSEWPQKHKLGRECWDLASCQVSLNFVQRLQRSWKSLSQS